MLWVFETQIVGDFTDGFLRIKDSGFCQVDNFGVNVVLGRLTGFPADEITKIIRGEVKTFGAVGNGGQANGLGKIGVEVAIEQGFKFFEDAFIGVFSGYKLSVIKTCAVIKEQFEVGSYEFFTVFVDRLLQLKLDFVKAVQYYLSFFFGEVEGFVDFITEEVVFMNLFAQRGAFYQIWMKQKGPTFGSKGGCTWLNAQDLPWSDKYQGAFLVVV